MILTLVCLLAMQSEDQTYRIGGDVSAPSVVNRPEPRNPSWADGSVMLAMEVTKDGLPEKVRVVRPLEPVADQAVIDAIRQWTFRPGMKSGKPVRVAATVEVRFRVRKTWRVGEDGVTAPKLTERAEPVASNPEMSGTVVLSVEVSEEGRAEEIRVQRSVDPTLDRDAIEAVKKWKFKPGTKDGSPVRVAATVEVNFRRR